MSRSRGKRERGGDQRGEHDQHPGREARRVQPAERARDLAVGRQRVGQAREPEHRRVRGGDQRHRGDGGDRVLERVAQPLLLEGGDDAEHRGVEVAARQRRLAVDHRLRAHRDEGDPGVDDEHRQRRRADQARRSRRETATSPARPAADSRPVDTTVAMPSAKTVPERRRRPEVDRVGDRVGVEQQRHAEHDHQQLEADVGDDERGDARGARRREAADVARPRRSRGSRASRASRAPVRRAASRTRRGSSWR